MSLLTRKQVILLFNVIFFGISCIFLPAGEKKNRNNKNATPVFKNIRIIDWKLEKLKGKNGHRKLKGYLKLKNTGKTLDALAISLEFHNQEAKCLQQSKWLRFKGKFAAGAVRKRTLELPDPGEFTILWLYVRYFTRAQSSGKSIIINRRKIKTKLNREVDTSSLSSIDEVFFSLSLKKPEPYTPDKLTQAINLFNKSKSKPEQKQASQLPAEGGLAFADLKLQASTDGTTSNITFILNNNLQVFKPGQLQLELIIKDASAKIICKTKHTVKDKLPLGKTTIVLKKQTIGGKVESWEVNYRY